MASVSLGMESVDSPMDLSRITVIIDCLNGRARDHVIKGVSDTTSRVETGEHCQCNAFTLDSYQRG